MAVLVGVTPSPRSGQALSRGEGACPERSEGSPRRQPRQRRCFAAAPPPTKMIVAGRSRSGSGSGCAGDWDKLDSIAEGLQSGHCSPLDVGSIALVKVVGAEVLIGLA